MFFFEMKDKIQEQKIELLLPKYDDESVQKGLGDVWGRFPASIDKITEWFNQYQIESIELWISGIMETGTIPRLVVSAKGEGGMKVVLKPKKARR
jgi:hypothetical protein